MRYSDNMQPPQPFLLLNFFDKSLYTSAEPVVLRMYTPSQPATPFRNLLLYTSSVLSWGKCPRTSLYLYKSCTGVFSTLSLSPSLCTSACTNKISACAAFSLRLPCTLVHGNKTYSNRQTTYCYKPNICNDRHSTILFILCCIHLTGGNKGLLFTITCLLEHQ